MFGRSSPQSFVKLALPLAVLALLGASRPVDEPECVRAARWVEAHRDHLPSTFVQLRGYAPVYQVRILAALPLDAQKELWRQHLQAIEDSAHLNPTQRTLVQHWNISLDYFFDSRASLTERRARIGATLPALRANFSKTQIGEIFTSRGLLSHAQTVDRRVNKGDCVCFLDGECNTGFCHSDRSCPDTGGGCGPGGQYPCQGYCQ